MIKTICLAYDCFSVGGGSYDVLVLFLGLLKTAELITVVCFGHALYLSDPSSRPQIYKSNFTSF